MRMRGLTQSLVVAAVALSASATAQESSREYHECILNHVEPGMGTEAVNAVRASCRALHPPQWEVVGTTEYTSRWSADNHERAYQSQYCTASSPDGGYCADTVSIEGSVPEPDNDYVYRFSDTPDTCPPSNCPVQVTAGRTGGWFQTDAFVLNATRTSFRAEIRAWTRPQQFTVTLTVERRPR